MCVAPVSVYFIYFTRESLKENDVFSSLKKNGRKEMLNSRYTSQLENDCVELKLLQILKRLPNLAN